MYNRTDSTEAATLERIAERTLAFSQEAEVGSRDSLSAFARRWEETRADQKLLSELPNCPFLGLLGYEDRTGSDPRSHRVGCLVHPLQNDGVDGRDCGVYDRQTCEEYLCAAHDLLAGREKMLVVQAIGDSYLYGLVITDVRFVRQLFERAADINGMDPPTRCVQRAQALEAAGAYFELKRDWPYRAEDGVFGQMRAGQGLECSRRAGPAIGLGMEPGPFDAVLTCLGTKVSSADELRAARATVRERVEAFARAVSL